MFSVLYRLKIGAGLSSGGVLLFVRLCDAAQ